MPAKFVKEKLTKRVVSALILAPLTVFIIWQGGYLFLAFIALGTTLAMYEWAQIAKKTDHNIVISLLGLLYISCAGLALFKIREMGSFEIMLTFMFTIWASDTLAYFMGKIIGGKKLIPAISPNKTWAGMFGAILGPIITLVLSFFILSKGDSSIYAETWLHWIFVSIILGIMLGIAGQAGDLIVSYLKRLADVKDSGNLIPGHGGLLDRIDSLLLSSIILGLAYGVMLSYG